MCKRVILCFSSDMTRLRLLFLLAAVFVQMGCASDTVPTTDTTDANGNAVSNVPWNKPESWETQGQLGGALGH